MITVMLISALVSASCVAAAGLIASAQNSVYAGKAMGGLAPTTEI